MFFRYDNKARQGSDALISVSDVETCIFGQGVCSLGVERTTRDGQNTCDVTSMIEGKCTFPSDLERILFRL